MTQGSRHDSPHPSEHRSENHAGDLSGSRPSNHYAHLFAPIEIGSMRLRNRIVMSPMETQYGSLSGSPTQRTIDYYVERARGGVGLITLGASSVDALHKEVPQSLHFSPTRAY